MPDYTPVIGMEVHVQLKTESKMFSSAKNELDEEEPNVNINEIDLGHPGTLPVPNKKAIEWTAKIGSALGCDIAEESKFDRKHYFYPDLPKGYQISQYDQPIAKDGELQLEFYLDDNIRDEAKIGIKRAHLEEDTGKSTHDIHGNTMVDFNRAGTPLVEIVTNPDFRNGLEAKKYCQELQRILRYLEVSDADMEKGHMRCEANISLQEVGKFEKEDGEIKPLGDYNLNNKVEVKNLNSFKVVKEAIDYEIDRQKAMLEEGDSWIQQTRGWNENEKKTELQRKKETAADYRYFPEPDIPPFNPLEISGGLSIPELPIEKRLRFHNEYGFSYSDAEQLTRSKKWASFAEGVMSDLVSWLHASDDIESDTDEILKNRKEELAQLAGNWMNNELKGKLKETQKNIDDLSFAQENFAELITLIYTDQVNSTNASKILEKMIDSDTDIDPSHIMEEEGYGQISDEDKIEEIVEEVIDDNPEQVQQYRDGKEGVLEYLVGMVMRATEGSADPQQAKKTLKDKL
ncbi:MAG: Asp-tRNA(Asn)/Glu-tRNA(Gln) amidotransferase subunit GatB [Candidatus Magasanikbacteria bacterium]